MGNGHKLISFIFILYLITPDLHLCSNSKTSYNCVLSLNCASVSHDGSLVAGEFLDSSLKVVFYVITYYMSNCFILIFYFFNVLNLTSTDV